MLSQPAALNSLPHSSEGMASPSPMLSNANVNAMMQIATEAADAAYHATIEAGGTHTQANDASYQAALSSVQAALPQLGKPKKKKKAPPPKAEWQRFKGLMKLKSQNFHNTNPDQWEHCCRQWKSQIRLLSQKQATKKPRKKTLTIFVQDQKGSKTFFKVKWSTRMGKVFQAYAERLNMDVSQFAFFMGQQRIDENQTPKTLNLSDNAKIVCASHWTCSIY